MKNRENTKKKSGKTKKKIDLSTDAIVARLKKVGADYSASMRRDRIHPVLVEVYKIYRAAAQQRRAASVKINLIRRRKLAIGTSLVRALFETALGKVDRRQLRKYKRVFESAVKWKLKSADLRAAIKAEKGINKAVELWPSQRPEFLRTISTKID